MTRTSNLWVALSFATAAGCALEPLDAELGTTTRAIIGGVAADSADYPSVVALEETPGNWFCTGTLIAPQWVLTAAHCVMESTAAINVRFGDNDVSDTTGGTVVAVAAVHTHPEFDWKAWDNDIALLELAQPVTSVTPTPIYRDVVPAATPVIDVGYGVADNMDGGGGLLRSVEKVTADCAGANDASVSGDVLVCMDASDGRGSCYGDSGGPTFAMLGGQRVVAGVTSGGTGDACGAGWDLYTSIHAELAFLDATMTGAPTEPTEPTEPSEPSEPSDPSAPADPTMDEPADGGCNAGGSVGGLVGLLLGVALLRRRRD